MIFDAISGKMLYQMMGHSKTTTAIAWDPTGQYIASAGDDSTVRLWDASSGRQVAVLDGHEGPVNDVDWSPDGTRVVSSSNDARIVVWQVAAKEKLYEIWVDSWTRSVDSNTTMNRSHGSFAFRYFATLRI